MLQSDIPEVELLVARLKGLRGEGGALPMASGRAAMHAGSLLVEDACPGRSVKQVQCMVRHHKGEAMLRALQHAGACRVDVHYVAEDDEAQPMWMAGDFEPSLLQTEIEVIAVLEYFDRKQEHWAASLFLHTQPLMAVLDEVLHPYCMLGGRFRLVVEHGSELVRHWADQRFLEERVPGDAFHRIVAGERVTAAASRERMRG